MKNLLILLFATIILISCQKKVEEKPAHSTQNEKIVKEYYEHFNSHNWQKMAAMYTDTAEFKDPSLGLGIVKQSQKQIEEKYAGLNATFADIHDKIENMYHADSSHVIVEFVSTGTAPDQSKFELPICTIFTIKNGKITQDFTYYDNFEDTK